MPPAATKFQPRTRIETGVEPAPVGPAVWCVPSGSLATPAISGQPLDLSSHCHEDQSSEEMDWTEERLLGDCHYGDRVNTPACQDDGDYETLDRYWKIKSCKHTVRPSVEYGAEGSSGAQEVTHANTSASSDVCVEKWNNKDNLMCQLTVFSPPSAGSYTDARSTHRTVCLYSIEGISRNQEELLSTLQKSRLLVLPASPCNSEPLPPTSGDILLSPVTEGTQQADSAHYCEQTLNPSRVNTYARIKERQLPAIPSDNKPKVLRRSTSFQVSKPDESTITREIIHRRRCSDFINSGQGSTNTMAEQRVSLTAEEMKEIFAKLGPLPPLPTTNWLTVNKPKHVRARSCDQRLTPSLYRHQDISHSAPWRERQETLISEHNEQNIPDHCNLSLQGHTDATKQNVSSPTVSKPLNRGLFHNSNIPYPNTHHSQLEVTHTAPNATDICETFSGVQNISLDQGDEQRSSISDSNTEDHSDRDSETEENFYFELEVNAAFLEDSDEEDFSGIPELFSCDI